MKRSVSAGLVALVTMLAGTVAPSASWADASQYDGTYTGYLACDALPHQSPLREKMAVDVSHGQVQYARDVMDPGAPGQHLGVREAGKGTVSDDGAVSITGSVGGRDWDYKASYQGQITGTTMELAGVQNWNLPKTYGGGKFTRPCKIHATK
jgi:hypothetical protein